MRCCRGKQLPPSDSQQLTAQALCSLLFATAHDEESLPVLPEGSWAGVEQKQESGAGEERSAAAGGLQLGGWEAGAGRGCPLLEPLCQPARATPAPCPAPHMALSPCQHPWHSIPRVQAGV